MRALQSRRECYHAHRDKNRDNQPQMSPGKHYSEPYFNLPQLECRGEVDSFGVREDSRFSNRRFVMRSLRSQRANVLSRTACLRPRLAHRQNCFM